jgi:hypothetical protein
MIGRRGESAEHHQTLLGQTTINGQVYEDLNDLEAIFFTFPDLSVRIQGVYTLQIQLIQIDQTLCHSPIYTTPFVVYAPKNFPGMLESTKLSNHLANQGLAIRSRKFVIISKTFP